MVGRVQKIGEEGGGKRDEAAEAGAKMVRLRRLPQGRIPSDAGGEAAGAFFWEKALALLFPTLLSLASHHAAVAQLDRASDYGSEGLGFDSLQLRQFKTRNPKRLRVFCFATTPRWSGPAARGAKAGRLDSVRPIKNPP